jgi:hypothetical protein
MNQTKPLPPGCDKQGRYTTQPDRAEWPRFPDTVPGIQPVPAEACTDIGAADEPKRWPWQKTARFVAIGAGLFWLGIPALWHLGSRLIASLAP